MQVSEAQKLREDWRNKLCNHPNLEMEYDFLAETGKYACTTCGKVFKRSEIMRGKENKKPKP